MILNVTNAEYKDEFRIYLSFDNGESYLVDLKNAIQSDTRKIFAPLRDIDYFRRFKLHLNTITWENEADFAPEFLLELGRKQHPKEKICA